MRLHARRRLAFAGAALTLAAVTLTGCSSDTGSTGGSAAGVTAPATIPGQVTLVDPVTFQAAAAQDGVVLLDVRTPQEYSSGHIDGALNISLESATFAQEMAALDPTVTYAVYCRSGNRSAAATSFMLQSGFAAPYELAGGIVAWEQAAFPVV